LAKCSKAGLTVWVVETGLCALMPQLIFLLGVLKEDLPGIGQSAETQLLVLIGDVVQSVPLLPHCLELHLALHAFQAMGFIMDCGGMYSHT